MAGLPNGLCVETARDRGTAAATDGLVHHAPALARGKIADPD